MARRELSRATKDLVEDEERAEELIMFLERDQLVADTSRPVARVAFGSGVQAALWALRVFVIVVSLMVVYTFVHGL